MRRKLFASAVVGVVVVAAAGVAYAAIPGGDGTIQGCYTKIGGILRVVDSIGQCKGFETPISWSQKCQKGDPGVPGAPGINGANGANGANGTNGADGTPGTPGTNGTNGAPGVSPSVSQLAPNDPNCPAGGAAITDSAGSTAYVCSGQNGQAGVDGQPFSGTFTSPNGQYSISVTDAGISVKHANDAFVTVVGSAIAVRGGTVAIDAAANFDVKAGLNATVRAGADAIVRGDQNVTILASGTTNIAGSTVKINDATTCHQAARVGDTAIGASNAGGNVVSAIVTGSNTVCIG